MKHSLDSRFDVCRRCNLSAEAIFTVPVAECPGHELVTTERGFPIPLGAIGELRSLWQLIDRARGRFGFSRDPGEVGSIEVA